MGSVAGDAGAAGTTGGDARAKAKAYAGLAGKGRKRRNNRKAGSKAKTLARGKLSRGDRNIRWIERHCRIPEGKFVGGDVKLREWQRDIIRGIYDTPTRRAIISFGRKNAKTTLSAFLLLLHLCGPEARANSQLFSAAQSRDQASILFALAAKIVRLSQDLNSVVAIRDTAKQLYCPELGTLYRALSADASTAYGLSPVFVVHDELGQVRGPRSELYEALETAGGAQESPLSIVISTQAPSDADLLSVLIDDAKTGANPTTKLWLYTAEDDLDPFSDEAMQKANPALGDFLNETEVREQAEAARRLPSREASYRNLILNQRVNAQAPFITQQIWKENGDAASPLRPKDRLYLGLDLSAVADLTSLEAIKDADGLIDVYSTFWLPQEGLAEKSRADKAPYDMWSHQGLLLTTPGASIEYEYVAQHLRVLFNTYDVRAVAFDRYNMKFLKPWLEKAGFTEEELKRFIEFGQGFISMSPAIRELESLLLARKMRHGNHPVLTMCFANAVVAIDPAENRKFVKGKATGRIDGAVALAMAVGAKMLQPPEAPVPKFQFFSL